MDTQVLSTMALLAAIASRIVEILFKPIYDHYSWDKFTLAYLAIVLGGTLGWFAGLNALPILQPPVGRIVTAVLAGLGPGALYDLLDWTNQRTVALTLRALK